MVNYIRFIFVLVLVSNINLSFGQEGYEIRTLFNPGHHASGGYVALSNKFTELNGSFANLTEIYGGWYINHKFLLGLGAAAATNNIRVPMEKRVLADRDMSYAYGQFGLMTEYVLWSHRVIHLSFHAMTGAGFTTQYIRNAWEHEDYYDRYNQYPHDTNWFYVVEPGIKLEMNVLKWMRFSPGLSYRAVYESNPESLTNEQLSGMALNLTLKFGKF